MLAAEDPEHCGISPLDDDELSCNAVHSNMDDCDSEHAHGKLFNAWVSHSKNRCLDTIAKIFARESPLQKKHYRMLNEHEAPKGNTADHVTAAGLEYGSEEGVYRIILAKNGGFDAEDQKFASRLFSWMNDCMANNEMPHYSI